MRRLLIALLTLCTLWTFRAAAHPTDSISYIYPIREVARRYSANFGEMRPGHFHAGIDIKTDGVEGKPLVAAADGYIARMVVQSGGYGRALYLTTADGTTCVYAHLQRFRPDLETHMQRERYTRQSNRVDCWFTADRFPVRQGELIGYSGNSGSSSGPHLHYEMRQGKDQQRINLIREGYITPHDTLPPRFMKLHYVEIDTLENGIPMRSAMESYAVVRHADGIYRPTHTAPIPVGTKGYFIAEVTDRRNGVHNTFSVWRLTAEADGVPYFEFRIDRFPYELSATCDVVSCYPLQLTSRNEVIRVAQMEGAPDCFYPTMLERGLLRTAPAQRRTLRMELEDDCGNCSEMRFEVIGRDTSLLPPRPTDPHLRPLFTDCTTLLHYGTDFTAEIPADALYEPCYARPEAGLVPAVDSGVVVLSPAYRIFDDPRIPLRKNIRIAIRAHVPKALQAKALLALRNRRGKAAWCGGTYSNGEVDGSLRALGDWFVAADTLPPTITPLFTAKSNLASRGELRFQVADNFTGIASWRLEVDDEWVPCDRYPSRGQLIWHIDRAAEGRLRKATLTVTDGVGNRRRESFLFQW